MGNITRQPQLRPQADESPAKHKIMVAEGDAANNNGHQADNHHFYKDPYAMNARYGYTVILILGCILAWAVRNNHVLSFFERQRRNGCQGNRDCLATEAILLISFTLFLFYMTMFLTTVNTKKVQDIRHVWHSHWGCWPVKLFFLVIYIIISTVAPSNVIQLYGKVSPLGAGILIFIQVKSVIRYVTRLNYKWCLTNMEERYRRVIIVAILGYGGSTVGTILMGLWYADCWQNITFIIVTWLLVLLVSLMSMISKAKGFYMESGLLGAYIVFLCWSAIKSEATSLGENWKTVISFIGGLISIGVAAFSTGKDYKCLQFRNVVLSADDVPYAYGFFHLVFAMGCMFFAMMFVGWDTHHSSGTWSMDAGWTSTWIHLANEGLVVIFFVLILIARVYRIDWLRQRLEGFFGIEGEQGGEFRITELEMNTIRPPPPSPPLPQTAIQISESINDIGGSSSNNSEPAGSPSALVITITN